MVLYLIAAVDVALFGYFLYTSIITQPYWDMLSIVGRYLQYLRDGNLWAYLWEPHVQHRHVWMRLLTAADARFFGGIGYPFVLAALVCQLVSAWLVWTFVQRELPGGDRRWVGTLAVMLVLTSVAAVDCAIPMNGIYPQALMFSLFAVMAFDRGTPSDGAAAARWRVLAMAAAIGAAFGNAATLCLWPILAWTAWKSDVRRGWAAAVLVVGVAFGALYIHGLPAGTSDGAAAFEPLRAADYLVTYLGLPWTRSPTLLMAGKLVGGCLLLASLGLGVWGLARPVTSRLDRAAIALVAFSFATAVLAALGRSGVDADLRVPVRYSVFVTPLHIGLLLVAWPRLGGLMPVLAPARRRYATALVLALALTLQQVAAGRAAAATTASMRDTLARFAAGEETEDMRTVVYVDLGQARRDLNAIHAAGLYLRAR